MLPTTLKANEVKTKMDRRDRETVLETDRNEHVAENKLQGRDRMGKPTQQSKGRRENGFSL